jgi:hypothetical protein
MKEKKMPPIQEIFTYPYENTLQGAQTRDQIVTEVNNGAAVCVDGIGRDGNLQDAINSGSVSPKITVTVVVDFSGA